jgi:hypothetical protein
VALTPAAGVAACADDVALADGLTLERADGGLPTAWTLAPVAVTSPVVVALGVLVVRAPCVRNGIIA